MKKQRGELYTLNRRVCEYNEGTIVRVYEKQTTSLVTCTVLNSKMKSTGEFIYPHEQDLEEYKA